MSVPAISLQQANRFVLMRQHLLAPSSDPVQVTIDACGLQAQVPSTPAQSLRCRVTGFAPADYDRLLADDRSLVRTWGMRGTVHVFAADRLAQYTRVYASPDGLSPMAEQAYALLADGPGTRGQLARRAMERYGMPEAQAKELFGPWGGILSRLARAGLTVHMPAPGADVPMVRVIDWLGRPLPDSSREDLEEALLRDYLRGYGPASMRDFAHFAGFELVRARAAFDRVRGNLTEVRVADQKEPCFILTDDLAALQAMTGDEPAPVQLLPRFDSLILVHRDKRRFLAEEWRRFVFGAGAQVEAVVLMDGRVVGIWKMKKTARKLDFTFGPFGEQPADAVAAAAADLARWYGVELGEFRVEPVTVPQAEVAARKATIEAALRKEKAPRLLKQMAFVEPLRDGELIHVPALSGFAAARDQIISEGERLLAFLAQHRIARPDVDLGALDVRAIRPSLMAISPRPGRESTAVLDSDLVPLTERELKWSSRVLHALADGLPRSSSHLALFNWFLSRCTENRRRVLSKAPWSEQMHAAVDDLVCGLEQAVAAEVKGTERAGEAWTPRKVLRRAIFYVWTHRNT